MNDIIDMKEAINNSDMDTKMKAKINNFIQIIEKVHMQVPRIYYAAAAFGLGSVAIGMFSAIPIAVICGIAVFFIALVGISEVICIRRKIGGIND